MYSSILGYEIHDVEAKYYADGEDAYDMRKYFGERRSNNPTKKDPVEETKIAPPSTALKKKRNRKRQR